MHFENHIVKDCYWGKENLDHAEPDFQYITLNKYGKKHDIAKYERWEINKALNEEGFLKTKKVMLLPPRKGEDGQPGLARAKVIELAEADKEEEELR